MIFNSWIMPLYILPYTCCKVRHFFKSCDTQSKMYLSGFHKDFRMEGPGWLCFDCGTCKNSIELLLRILAASWPWPFRTFCCEKSIIHKPSQLWPTQNASNTGGVSPPLHVWQECGAQLMENGCCFWISTVTSTCHTVWLCQQGARQTAVCDIQGENMWREWGWYVEI